MRALIKFLFLLLLLAGPVVAGLYLALSETPLVTDTMALSHADIARAKAIVKRNDPRRLPNGAYRTIEIAPQDLNLAANYLLHRFADGKASLALADRRLDTRATWHFAQLPMRPYLNLTATIEAEGGKPRVTHMTLGSVPIPDIVSNWAAQQLLGRLSTSPGTVTDTDQGGDFVQGMKLYRDRLELTYRWNPELINQARDTLLSGSDQQALRFYHDQLVDMQARGIGRKGSLINLLGPMFASAQSRSREHGAVTENTALLTVLGTWASNHDLARLVPGNLARPQRFRLKLNRRTDFAQHFLTSAALAARGDSALSDAVGLFKEISDTDNGSGFSFTDIAADRAGTRFGALASRSDDDARRLQQRMASGIQESDIMPPVGDLPEHMRSAVFKQRFGHVGSPAYHAMMDDIDRRIDACGLYRD